MSINAIKGQDLVLSVSVDAGVTFLPCAGIKTRDLTRENPVADNTNQATTGNETASCPTGYGTVTMSGSGAADTTGTAGVYPLRNLIAAANSADPSLLMRLQNADLGSYEGSFNITSCGVNSEENGLVEFSIALQNAGVITFTAGV